MAKAFNNCTRKQLEHFRLGAFVAKFLEPEMTFDEIAAELGVSKGRVWQIQCVAFGKLAKQLQQRGWTA